MGHKSASGHVEFWPDNPTEQPGYTAEELREILKDDVTFINERLMAFAEHLNIYGRKSSDTGMAFNTGVLLAEVLGLRRDLSHVFQLPPDGE